MRRRVAASVRPTLRSEFEYLFQRICTVLIICLSLTSVLRFAWARFGARRLPVSAFISGVSGFPSGWSDPTGYLRFDEAISFEPKELTDAISNLALPTWSRAHVACSDARSEVTCGRVVKAWRAIRRWEMAIQAQGNYNDTHMSVIHTFTRRGGIGNRAMQETVASVIGMVMDRAVSVYWTSGHQHRDRNEYEYPPSGVIRYARGNCPHTKQDMAVRGDGTFFSFNFSKGNYAGSHFSLRMTFLSSMAYLHPQLSSFCREHFGSHAQYFLLNYLIRIPIDFRSKCAKLIEFVPRSVRLFGIHLRFHMVDSFFARSVPDVLAVTIPFCKAQMAKRPTQFVLGTDNQALFDEFKRQVDVVSAPVYRKPDSDQPGALTDLTLLMMCEEFLLTARSTFSSMIAIRVGKWAWLMEKNTQEVYRLTHSQVSHQQTPLYMHMPQWKPFDMTAIANMGAPGQVEALRFYYRYFVL
jgi:hypothetical protein